VLFVACPLTVSYVALFVINGVLNGWATSYDVSLAIVSPWDKTRVALSALAFPLSFAGWILMPSFVGAIAGYVVAHAIAAHRETSAEDIAAKLSEDVDGSRNSAGT
jgi:hypothetical protein